MALRQHAEGAVPPAQPTLARGAVRPGHEAPRTGALPRRGVAQPAVTRTHDRARTTAGALRPVEARAARAAAVDDLAGLAEGVAGPAAVVREGAAREGVAEVLGERAAAGDGGAVPGQGQHGLHGLAGGAVRHAAVDAVQVEELVLAGAQRAAGGEGAVHQAVAEGLDDAAQVLVPVVGAGGVVVEGVGGVGEGAERVVGLVPLRLGPGGLGLHLEGHVGHLVHGALPFTLVKPPDAGEGGRVLGDVGQLPACG